jgi:hypothetical protein
MHARTTYHHDISRSAFLWLKGALSIFLLSMLASCYSVKLVPDYDAESVKAITETSAEVFAFYDKVIEAKLKQGKAKLPYAGTEDDWGKIETRIRVLSVREEARPLNDESIRITRIILELWGKRRAKHRETDDYSAKLAIVHRDRFQRLFVAALQAENAKALATEETSGKNEE